MKFTENLSTVVGAALLSVVAFSLPQFSFANDSDHSIPRAVEAALAMDEAPKPVREPIPGSLWPQFRVYAKANAKPAQVEEVFIDSDHHKEYFKDIGITKSEIIKGRGTSKTEVAYFLKFPMGLGSDDYATTNVLEADIGRGVYTVSWEVVRSTACISKTDGKQPYSTGNVRLEPYEDGTLITYTSRVSPKDRMGVTWGWVIDGAEKTVVTTVGSLVKQVESELKQNPQEMDRQLEALRTALAN